jgi:hypothetical protein
VTTQAATLAVIVATLTGSDHASAEGVHVNSPSPVLVLCRRLRDLGYYPALPMIVTRADTIALRIISIGKAAGLEITGEGVGLRQRHDRARPHSSHQMARPMLEAIP